MREILVDWQTPAGGTHVGVFYFDDESSVAAQRSALAALCTALDTYLCSAVTWAVRTEGKVINPATGVMTSTWSEATAHTGTGGGSAFMVPDLAQVLLKWTTAAVVNGRVLRGRTFIPGVDQQYSAQGNVAPAVVAAFAAAAQDLCDALVGFGVWHRPTAGAGGSHSVAVQGGAWSEFASQRRRRS